MTVGSTMRTGGGLPQRNAGRGSWTAWLLLCGLLAALPAPVAAQAPHEKAFADLIVSWTERAKGKNADKALKDLEPVWNSFEEARGIVLLTEGDPQYKANVKKQDDLAKKVLPLLEEAAALAQGKEGVPADRRLELLVQLVELELELQRYAEAGVVADYYARAFPENESALALAERANVAFIKQMTAPGIDEAKKTAFRKQVVAINDYIAEKWPKEEAAKDARSRLAQLALASGDANQALEIAKKLPENSPQRAEIQLQMGLQQWSDYLKLSKLPAGDAKRPSDVEMEKKRLATKKTLDDGVALIRKHGTGDPTFVMLTSELALAQIHLELGDAKAALDVLQRPKTGLLDLAMANAPVVQGNNLQQQIYAAALKCFLQLQNFDQAEAMLERLGGATDDPAKLVALRLSLARQLDKELEEAHKSGADPKTLADKSKGFAGLLKKVSANAGALDFGSAAWVAKKQFELARSMDPEGPLSADDKETVDAYNAYGAAMKLYEALLAKTTGKPADSTEGKSRMGLRFEIAKCQRRLGMFKEALAFYEEILQTAPKNMEAQIEAAKTYQDWAEVSGDRQHWRYAMAGGPVRKTSSGDKESSIIGWAGIALELRNPNGKYAKEYYDSRYNLELCRAKSASTAPEAEARKLYQDSEQALITLYTVRRELDDGPQRAKFEPLLIAVQKRLGKEATGFPKRDQLASLSRAAAKPEEAPPPKRSGGLPQSSYTVLILAGTALILALVACYFVYQRSQNKPPPARKSANLGGFPPM